MEFSASLPVDLDALAASWQPATGPEAGARPAGAPKTDEPSFAATLAGKLDAVERDGETLPPDGSGLPLLSLVLPAEPLALPATVTTLAPGQPPGPLPMSSAIDPAAAPQPMSATAEAVKADAAAQAETAASPVAANDDTAGIAAPAAEDSGDGTIELLPTAARRPAAEAVQPLPVPAEASPGGRTADAAAARAPGPAAEFRLAWSPGQGGQQSAPQDTPDPPPAVPFDAVASAPTDADAASPPGQLAPSAALRADPAAPLEQRTAAPADSLPGPRVDLTRADAADGLATRIHWAADRNLGAARISLHPPEFGSIDIRLSVVDDHTVVHMTATHAAARDLLEGNLPRLRDMLALGGLTLGDATVGGGERNPAGAAPPLPLPPELPAPAPRVGPAEPAAVSTPPPGIDLYA
jgi:flagellar hook-length control protein FliK